MPARNVNHVEDGASEHSMKRAQMEGGSRE